MKKEMFATALWVVAIVLFVIWLRFYQVPWLPAIIIAMFAGAGVNAGVRVFFERRVPR